MESQDNKRLVYNTFFMYFRMLFLTLINLYTVRITLKVLGDIDYGIYNVVGSVVTSLGFVTGTMTSATQRFLAYNLGKKDIRGFQDTFGLMLLAFIVISILCVCIGEFIGIFFIDDILTIPENKIYAAKWVYQTSIIIFIMSLISIPYTASIIAHEKMKIFAYVSIADGILKLLIVWILRFSSKDNLILYGILLSLESTIVLLLYASYCTRSYAYCKFRIIWKKDLFKEIVSYSGWNLMGSVSSILCTQGQNILLNVFFGPIVNTAKSIGDRISNVVMSFSSNFYVAVTPQIIKSYAEDNLNRTILLVLKSTRISFFLILILSFPIIQIIPWLLQIWLGQESVTNWMSGFSILAIIHCLCFSLEQPITQLIRATGNVRYYQIFTSIFTLSYLPLALLVLKFGGSPLSTMIVLILIIIVVQVVRVIVAHKQVGLSYKAYFKEILIPIIKVLPGVVAFYLIIHFFWHPSEIKAYIFQSFIDLLFVLIYVYILGLKKIDRILIVNLIKKFRNNDKI